MTPGENGPSTPEDDDPFGYLYADGQARGAQPPSGGYGYPNSVSRVRTVGERQYGGGPQQPQYGQPTVPQQQVPYGQPNAHYQAPETLPGGAPPNGPRSAPPAPGRRGPNTKGLLIGAIAVVAAVVIGIGIAMLNGPDDKKNNNQAGGTPSQSQSQGPSPSGSSSAASGELKTDATGSGVQLAGGATKTSDVQGAQSSDGSYVGSLNQVGASMTWTVDNVPSGGTYTLFAHFSVVGDDQGMTVTVNGKPFGTKLPLRNYTHTPADLTKGWTTTYIWPTLKQGTNTISISCQAGDKCNALIDQLWLKQGQHTLHS
ncbi:carbohydrate-binding protein [Streptomyces sp. NPDC048191]|uniref:carbohydrate-binding protein n=1 Tax=Streptomyces sp. NPDC048191 TaxID=3155484 RepID=UPI0033E638D8